MPESNKPQIPSARGERGELTSDGTATLAEIARQAGVSAPTVSKVLNGRAHVAPATREKVELLLRNHGYRRKRGAARARPSGLLELVFHELISLWAQPHLAIKCMCIVTHNIDEAVLLADRVLVLGANPGHIKAEVPIHLPRPRDRRSPTFEMVVDQIYGILTGRGGYFAATGGS